MSYSSANPWESRSSQNIQLPPAYSQVVDSFEGDQTHQDSQTSQQKKDCTAEDGDRYLTRSRENNNNGHTEGEASDNNNVDDSYEDKRHSYSQPTDETYRDLSLALVKPVTVAKEDTVKCKEKMKKRDKLTCCSYTRCAYVTLGAFSVLCFINFLVLQFVAIGYLTNMTKEQLILSPASEKWLNPPVESQIGVYFFNVSNSEDFYNNDAKSFVPHVTEVGPYYYRVNVTRVNVTWHDSNNTVTFRNVVTFRFDREKSVGSDEDLVMGVNVPKIAVTVKSGTIGGMMGFNDDEDKMFEEHSVKEILWGYESRSFVKLVDSLETVNYFGMLDSTIAEIPSKFGYLWNVNATARPAMNVFTGKGDFNKFNQIHTWKDMTSLTYWSSEEANTIQGCDGSIFPPFLDSKSDVYLFSSQLYRSFNLKFEAATQVKGIDTLRFILPDSQLTNMTMPDVLSSSDNLGIVSRVKRDAVKQKEQHLSISPDMSNALSNYTNDIDYPIYTSEDSNDKHKRSDNKLDTESDKAVQPTLVHSKNDVISLDDDKTASPRPKRDSDVTRSAPTQRYTEPRANGGFCRPKCVPSGMYSLEPVPLVGGIPMFVSLPHFLGADPVYFNRTKGLKPDEEKHRPYFDIGTITGVALRGNQKYQLNMRLPETDTIVPCFWMDTFNEVRDQDADELKQLHFIFWAAKMSRWLMIGLSVCSLLIMAGVCAFNQRRTYEKVSLDNKPDKQDSYLADNFTPSPDFVRRINGLPDTRV